MDGTAKIIDYLHEQDIKIDACIVGEPSSNKIVGDTIKHGRRGSITGTLTVKGTQGHVAYPESAENPIHKLGPIITELTQTIWDEGNADFPPTTFQIANINGGTGTDNVIPGHVDYQFNLRYSTELNFQQIKNKMIGILNKHNVRYSIAWNKPDYPFLTKTGVFLNTCVSAIKEVMGIDPIMSTSGGTSDGRFLAPTGTHVVELGPCNATIHAVNEHIKKSDLEGLTQIYESILEKTLTRAEDRNIDDHLKV